MPSSTAPVIKNVALAGANGNLGQPFLQALVASGRFNITVLSRSSSKTNYPSSVNLVKVDFESIDSLREALRGHDALVSAVGKTGLQSQDKLIDAAVEAKVKRFIPSEFGGDLKNPNSREIPTYRQKVQLEDYLEDKASTSGMTYTYIYNNALLDWGLQFGSILDLKGRTCKLYDGGEHKFSTARISTVAQAVVGVLSNYEETKNRAVYIQDIALTQKRLLELAQKATPGEEWTITSVDTAELEKQARAEMATSGWTLKAFHAFAVRVAFGTGFGGHFKHLDNELLGIRGMTEADLEKLLITMVKKESTSR